MFTLCRIVFALVREPYRIRRMFTLLKLGHGDLGAIFLTERRATYRISVHPIPDRGINIFANFHKKSDCTDRIAFRIGSKGYPL